MNYTYTPDKLNRSVMTEVSSFGEIVNYSPNALNQYTSTAANSYSYDGNFNLTHAPGFNAVYDAANRLVSISNGGSGEAQQTIATFVYDGLGRCVKRTFNGVATVLVYDGWKPVGEFVEQIFAHVFPVSSSGSSSCTLAEMPSASMPIFERLVRGDDAAPTGSRSLQRSVAARRGCAWTWIRPSTSSAPSADRAVAGGGTDARDRGHGGLGADLDLLDQVLAVPVGRSVARGDVEDRFAHRHGPGRTPRIVAPPSAAWPPIRASLAASAGPSESLTSEPVSELRWRSSGLSDRVSAHEESGIPPGVPW